VLFLTLVGPLLALAFLLVMQRFESRMLDRDLDHRARRMR
jgi:hypothetical protein